jgi:hypothetical protein
VTVECDLFQIFLARKPHKHRLHSNTLLLHTPSQLLPTPTKLKKMSEQPDGSYPRLNGKMLQTGRFSNQIVSLLGKVIMFDGSTIKLQCADGVIAIINCEPDAEVQQGHIYELVGHANEDNTLQVSHEYY